MLPIPPSQARLAGQVAIVTGASRGIGRAVALTFAREGADIVLNYARNHAAASEVAASVADFGRRCILVQGSVAELETADRLVAAAYNTFGRVDILVNNAGVAKEGHLMMLQDSAWEEMFSVNVHGACYCIRAVLAVMAKQHRGIIINMSSTAGVSGRPGQVGYAATKGALIGLTKTLARQLGPDGIRINAVAPGFIETDMVAGLLGRPGVRDTFLQATPVRRLGTVDDVASAALFLATSESAFITGDVMLVNGGIFT